MPLQVSRLLSIAPFCLLFSAADAEEKATPAASAFNFRENDRVVLLGGTFFERDYDHAYLETALSTAFADKRLRFRNLAWSADTVWGHSRSYFGPPSEGLDRLRNHLEQIKPTVVLCNYGAAEAWDGEEKLTAFLDAYTRLLDLMARTAGKPRIILISPLPVETLPPPLPNLDEQNQRLALYGNGIKKLASERGLAFYDAFKRVTDAPKPGPLTENGVAFSEAGYRFIGSLIGSLAQNRENNQPVPPLDEKLRTLILDKNKLFFHRWRPANETYLFGFRKHEQGNNAAEIPLFDPLIEAKEKEIAAHLGPRP
ncbi:MAG: SGNH/GDSL hydrolase family protein [Verrucomicrobiales bacterium]